MLKLPRKIPQGSIMLEAMAATVILSLAMVASTPPIFMAVTTRIQARRVAESIQLAQLEIDKIREVFSTGYSLGTTNAYTSTDLPPVATGKLRATLSTNGAPTSICTTVVPSSLSSTSCTTVTATATLGKIVYLNDQAFLVQTFSSTPLLYSTIVTSQGNQPIAFRMGVRVYSLNAIQNFNAGGTLLNETQTNTSIGLHYDQSAQGQAPLVVLYTDFVRGDLSASQQAYTTFLTTY